MIHPLSADGGEHLSEERAQADAANRRTMRRLIMSGCVATVVFVGGFGVWAAAVPMSSAVIATGNLVVETNVKRIQHPTGGVVGAIAVKDGDRVKEGDLLVRLDETLNRANLAVVSQQIDELTARLARLSAERDGADAPIFPADLEARRSDAAIAQLLTSEASLFEARRLAREGQIGQLRERKEQLREEAKGVEAQRDAKQRQAELLAGELAGLLDLQRQNLVPLSRVTALQRETARYEGEIGQLTSEIARSKGRMAEIELQIIGIGQDLRSEAATEIRSVQGKIAELEERRHAAEDQLRRVEIRAPQRGIVHQLQVHTIGGVVGAGDTLMLIVPEGDALVVEARVTPQTIESLQVGRPATIRLSGLPHATTPDLNGRVAAIGADLSRDAQTGQPFFAVRVAIDEGEAGRLNGHRLLPGMPADVFIKLQDRTLAEYLVKPLSDQIVRAFRER